MVKMIMHTAAMPTPTPIVVESLRPLLDDSVVDGIEGEGVPSPEIVGSGVDAVFGESVDGVVWVGDEGVDGVVGEIVDGEGFSEVGCT